MTLVRGLHPPSKTTATRMRPRNCFNLHPPRNWMALVDPIRAEVVSDVQHFDVLEAELLQFREGRPHIWTMVPRAASAIDDNLFILRHTLHAVTKHFDAARVVCWPNVFRAFNVRLRIENPRSNIQDQQFAALIRLQNADQGL